MESSERKFCLYGFKFLQQDLKKNIIVLNSYSPEQTKARN